MSQQQEFLAPGRRAAPGRPPPRTASLGTAPGSAAGQPGQRGGERLPGHDHHVVAEQEPAPQPGAQGQQPQGQARAGRGRARGPGLHGWPGCLGTGLARPGRGRRRHYSCRGARARADRAGSAPRRPGGRGGTGRLIQPPRHRGNRRPGHPRLPGAHADAGQALGRRGAERGDRDLFSLIPRRGWTSKACVPAGSAGLGLMPAEADQHHHRQPSNPAARSTDHRYSGLGSGMGVRQPVSFQHGGRVAARTPARPARRAAAGPGRRRPSGSG